MIGCLRRARPAPLLSGCWLVLTLLAGPVVAADDRASPQRWLVQLREAETLGTAPGPWALERTRRLGAARGVSPRSARSISPALALVDFGARPEDELTDVLAALRADPAVAAVERDERRQAHLVPTDAVYPNQWYWQGTELAAADAEVAWDLTTGAPDTVIAVLDTGIRFEHPDLGIWGAGGRLLPGFDFVSGESAGSFASANDGDGWDGDPSDPGDWVTQAESASGPLRGCPTGSSSWHGLRVAGMIGAITDNGVGIAGGTWEGGILPVRVLGKCGGFDSDIIAGMRWAAGLPVSGTPANPHPARIINMSLGSETPCSQAYRTVMNELTAAGVVVVVSAGNDSGPVDSPANCPGVLAVAGLRHVGTKVGYSSLGPQVKIAAPAGNCVTVGIGQPCVFSLITTTNLGVTVPGASGYTNAFNYNLGTSFAAPIVAAIAGLMHAVNDQLRGPEYIARMQAGARPFPSPEAGLPTCPTLAPETAQCNCTTTTCGAGIANAPGALAEALRPIARIVVPASAPAGQSTVLSGGDSAVARGRQLTAYTWSVVEGPPGAIIGSTGGSSAAVAVPAAGRVTIRLTVTDDAGRTDATEVSLGTSNAAAAGGGGGGGSMPWSVMVLLSAFGLLRSRRRRQR